MTTLLSPWEIYRAKLAAFFEKDPQVDVDIVYSEPDSSKKHISVTVTSHAKFEALSKILVTEVKFGNITLFIDLYDKENTSDADVYFHVLSDAFKHNERVNVVISQQDFAGTTNLYTMFKPEVIQINIDNTDDIYGNFSTLAQDIASEIFKKPSPFIHFNTSPDDDDELYKQMADRFRELVAKKNEDEYDKKFDELVGEIPEESKKEEEEMGK